MTRQRWEDQGYRDKEGMIAGDKGFEKKKKTEMQEGKAGYGKLSENEFLTEGIPKDQRGKITKLWVAPPFREQRAIERGRRTSRRVRSQESQSESISRKASFKCREFRSDEMETIHKSDIRECSDEAGGGRHFSGVEGT